MSQVPADLRYTADHEWVSAVSADVVRVGITDHAQDALGDIVFLTLPAAGATVEAGQACGEVESTKSVSDIYAPVSGEVASVNESLNSDPGLVSRDPYGAGWLARIRVPGSPDLSGLMSAAEYEAQVSGSPH